MKYEDRYIIELSRAAVFDDIPYVPKALLDWEYIFKKSIEQNITGLLYPALSKVADNLNFDAEFKTKWQNQMLKTIAFSGSQYSEFKKIYKLLKENNINIVGLKGCVIRNIYPVPELRTMGDFDIVCSEADIYAIRDLFAKNGYDVVNDVYGIICKKNIFYWEVFYSIKDEFRINTKKWNENIINDTTTIKGINCPNHTLFFLHLIVHTAKHFLREGAGIRNLCDIALFYKTYSVVIDFDFVQKAVDEQGATKIYNYIMNAISKYFRLNVKEYTQYISDNKIDCFFEYSLLNGIFGKNDNKLISQVSKNEDNYIKGYRKILFPSVKILSIRYRYLEKYPFLLPFAWINRLFRALFKWKYSAKELIKDMKEATEYSDERLQWLRELDLIE